MADPKLIKNPGLRNQVVEQAKRDALAKALAIKDAERQRQQSLGMPDLTAPPQLDAAIKDQGALPTPQGATMPKPVSIPIDNQLDNALPQSQPQLDAGVPDASTPSPDAGVGSNVPTDAGIPQAPTDASLPAGVPEEPKKSSGASGSWEPNKPELNDQTNPLLNKIASKGPGEVPPGEQKSVEVAAQKPPIGGVSQKGVPEGFAKVGLSGSSTTITEPTMGQEQGGKIVSGLERLKEGEKELSDAKKEAMANNAKVTNQMLEDANALKTLYGNKLTQILPEYEKAREITQKTLDEVNNYQIDPNRWFANMTTFQKVLFTIGITFGGAGEGFAHGMSGGRTGQNMANVIKWAVDKDLETQKTQFNALMQKYNLSKDQEDNLFRQWDAFSNKKQLYSLQAAQLQMKQNEMKVESITLKNAYDRAIIDLDMKINTVKEAMTPKKSVTKTYREDLVALPKPTVEKPEQAPAEFVTKLDSSLSILNQTSQLRDAASGNMPLEMKMRLGFSDAAVIDARIKSLISDYVYMSTGKAATEQETKRLADQLPSGATIVRLAIRGGSKKDFDTELRKLSAFENKIKFGAKQVVQHYPSLVNQGNYRDVMRLYEEDTPQPSVAPSGRVTR